MIPLTEQEPETLESLRHHWGGAYEIRADGPESWIAVRRDGKGILRADSPDTLLYAIRIDYRSAPVPRQGGAPDA